MKKFEMAIWMAAGALILAVPALPEAGNDQGQGQAIVTILPKHKEAPVNIAMQNVRVKIDRKDTAVTNWAPSRSPNDPLEMVILIDSSARESLGQELGDMANFIQNLPANSKVAVGYMEYGRAVMATPLTADHAQAVSGLRLPGGPAGSEASPYFCLSDLAQHWPSNDRKARREVVLITDGVDDYERRFDPDDPYVQAAITDSVRAGLVIYSIYWRGEGRMEGSMYESNAGQSLLNEVTDATGGTNFWQGMGNPVSFQPFFEDLMFRLQNQYRLSFNSPLKGKPEIKVMSLKVGGPAMKVYAPKQVFVDHANGDGK